jgi:MoaA/NifB/PqqE/SkfB family radical SAM enzyme
LRDDVAQVIGEAKRGGLTIGINTSGIPGSREVYRRFMDAGLDRLTFSLDAATAGVHDDLRPGAPWRRVIRNLEQAVAARNSHGFSTRIGTTTVLTRSNIQEILPLVELRKEVGADWNSFQPVWSSPSDRRFRERFGFTEADAGLLGEARCALRTVTNGNLEPYYEILPNLYGIVEQPGPQRCFGGRAFIHIDSGGMLRPCSPLRFGFGSLLTAEMVSLLRSSHALRFFRWADKGGCSGCSMTCYQERNLLLSTALVRPAHVFNQAIKRYFR